MIEDVCVKFIVWWRIHISGQLHLGEFLRYVMRDQGDQGEAL